ncbi:MAG: CBS domain-containing protein [Gemmatimonadota bacterium]|nr:CBS domain-containing protein [Gemmatimonadota bacterium]
MTSLTDIMTRPVKTVTADQTLKELAEFFIEERVSGAPVLSSGSLVGVVSATDLIEFDAEERGQPAYETAAAGLENADDEWSDDGPSRFFADPWTTESVDISAKLDTSGPIWNSLEEHTVEDVMTRQLLMLERDTPVQVAARRMMKAGVHRLLVMDGTDLIGVVTTTDIVRAVAELGLGG